MKRDDPRRLAARAAREKAADHVRVLANGFAHVLNARCYSAEEIRDLLGLMNELLPPALAASEKADEAYKPYRLYRRVRRSALKQNLPNPGRLKQTKTKAA